MRCEICRADIPGPIARTAMTWRKPCEGDEVIKVAPSVELAYSWVNLCSDDCLSALLVRNERDKRLEMESGA